MKKLVLLVVVAIVVSAVSGCRGRVVVDPYRRAWYDVYGNYCGSGNPSPGCNYYANGDKIIDIEDPFYASSYELEYAAWEYTDTFGYTQIYLGWAWWSPDNVLYDDLGRALNKTGSEEDRDIIATAGETQERNVMGAGKEFAARYALAEDVGINMARTLNDWAILAKTRARTAEDLEQVQKSLYNVDMNTAMAALEQAKQGDKTALNKAIVDVANHWGTSPETAREILKNSYNQFLTEYNID